MSDARLAGRLALAWATVILVFAVLPTHDALSRTVGDGETLATQVGHLVEFAALGWLLAAWLSARAASAPEDAPAVDGSGHGPRPDGLAARRVVVTAWVAAAAYGALIEALQAPLGYRSAQWTDLAIDAAGAFVGVLGFRCVAAWRAREGRRRAR